MRSERVWGDLSGGTDYVKASASKRRATYLAKRGRLFVPKKYRTPETLERHVEWERSKETRVAPRGKYAAVYAAAQAVKARREREADNWIKQVRARAKPER